MALDISGSSGPVSVEYKGLDAASKAMDDLARRSVDAAAAALLEAGLYLEAHLKMYTRVDTGRARASWGHFTPSDIRDQRVAGEARAAAVFEEPSRHNLEVTVGSRVVYMPVLNYRLGDMMMERAMQDTIHALPGIVSEYFKALA